MTGKLYLLPNWLLAREGPLFINYSRLCIGNINQTAYIFLQYMLTCYIFHNFMFFCLKHLISSSLNFCDRVEHVDPHHRGRVV